MKCLGVSGVLRVFFGHSALAAHDLEKPGPEGSGLSGVGFDWLPPVGYGSSNVEDVDTLTRALKAGYRHIDTGLLYANHKKIAEAIGRSGLRREQIFITTKVGFWPNTLNYAWKLFFGTLHDEKGSGMNKKGDERWAIKRSMQELNVSYIDLCLMHTPMTNPWELLAAYLPQRFGRLGILTWVPSFMTPLVHQLLEILQDFAGSGGKVGYEARHLAWRHLEEALRAGDCKRIGVSNYNAKLLHEMQDYSKQDISANQIEYHPLTQCPETIKYCHDHNIAVIGYGNHLGIGNPKIKEIASKTGLTSSQVSLRWALQKGAAVIPMSKNQARMKENLMVLNSALALSDENMAVIDSLGPGAPHYWDVRHVPTKPPPGKEERHDEL